jgi:hypothetical protein
MKPMTLEKEHLQSSVSNFFDKGSNTFVKCAYIKGQNCGPRCAACNLDAETTTVDIYHCKRGEFAIGSIKNN